MGLQEYEVFELQGGFLHFLDGHRGVIQYKSVIYFTYMQQTEDPFRDLLIINQRGPPNGIPKHLCCFLPRR